MKVLKTALAGRVLVVAAIFAFTFSGCGTAASVKLSEQDALNRLADLLDYLTVYENNSDKRFLANAVSDEIFDIGKTTYEYTSSSVEIVIRVNLTGDALLDFDHDYSTTINDAEQTASYQLQAGLNTFTVKVLDADVVLGTYTIHITRVIPENNVAASE